MNCYRDYLSLLSASDSFVYVFLSLYCISSLNPLSFSLSVSFSLILARLNAHTHTNTHSDSPTLQFFLYLLAEHGSTHFSFHAPSVVTGTHTLSLLRSCHRLLRQALRVVKQFRDRLKSKRFSALVIQLKEENIATQD